MGIDIDSRLVFGYIFSEEDLDKITSKLSETNVEFTTVYDEECLNFGNEFSDIFFGSASPYYDAPSDQRTYYISLFDSTQTNLSVEDLSRLVKWDTLTSYRKFLEYFGIQHQDPTMYSLPHVW